VSDEKPSVDDVVDRLGSVFEVLGVPANDNAESLLKQLGVEIGDQFCSMFIKDVLQNSVPVTPAEKSNFVQNISQKISEMQDILELSGMLIILKQVF